MYSILQNKSGEVMLLFEKSLGGQKPELPFFLYDGGTTALLMLSLFCGIKLKNLASSALEALDGASEIHIVEKEGEEVVRDYIAPVKKVSDVNALIL